MTLASQMQTDLDSVMLNEDEFATSITYDGTEIRAVVDYGQDQESERAATRTNATICVSKTDVSTVIYGTAVIIGATTWKVLRAAEGDAQSWEIELFTDERPIARR